MKIIEMLSRNTLWKFISLGLAILLWFVIINIENPVRTRDFTVKLELQNINTIDSETYVISNLSSLQATTVTLSVKGTRLALEELQQRRNEISAWIDLSKIDISKSSDLVFNLVVETKLPNIQTLNIDKKSITIQTVTIEPITEGSENVTVDIIGTANSSYYADKYFLDKTSFVVTGPLSSLEKISLMKVTIDITGATKDIIMSLPPVVYDDAGKVMTDVTCENVTVTIPIKKKVTLPVSNVTIEGSTPNGYAINSIITSQTNILAAVPDNITINELTLPVINIEGIITDANFTFDIQTLLPNGVTYIGNNKDITVSIFLSAVAERELTIPADIIYVIDNLADGLAYDIANNSVTFTLSGIPEFLDQVTPEKLNATIDISDYSIGEYNVLVDTADLENVSVISNNLVNVTIYQTEARSDINE